MHWLTETEQDLYASQLQDLDKALEDYNKAVAVEPENSY